jgi:hypothetical protein
MYMAGYAEFSARNPEAAVGEASVMQKPFTRSTLLDKVREVSSAAPCQPLGGTKVGEPS